MDTGIRIWMLVVCAQILVISAVTDSNDVSVLNAIRFSWQNLPPNWRGADPCGTGWEGIICNNNSRVTRLILAGMGVASRDIGDIPSLSALQYLDLSNNEGIRATIPPSLGNLTNLTTLILVGCNFVGPIPESIGSLPQLVYLGLNNNSLIGSIPPSIGSLSTLSWLDLSNNRLTGTIPVSNTTSPGLDMLLRARHLHLSRNQLSGTIQPRLFSSNMSLIHVMLDNNELTGDIPLTLGQVGSLLVVRLDRNSFDGPVPPTLNNLVNVTELNLSNNNLTGAIPNLTAMNALSYVDMSNNSFNASAFPSWIMNLQNLTTLVMERTQLQGEIPSDFFRLPLLENVVLSHNGLNGTLNIGSTYSNNLTLDLHNNSITSFDQNGGYNMNLTLLNNPICQGTGAEQRYCTLPRPITPFIQRFNGCDPVSCGADRILSPTCKCAHPYTGTINFYSFSFSNLGNFRYFNSLNGSLMSAFLASRLPVDSVIVSDPLIDAYSYLQFKLQVFPSFEEERFNRTGVSYISTLLNRHSFPLGEYFGPYYFLAQNYEFSARRKSSKVGVIVGATIGSFVGVILLVCVGLYAFRQKKRAESAMKQSAPFASWDPNKGHGSVPQLQGARLFSFDEIKKCTNNLSDLNIIGSGGYGQVYKGTIGTGESVAIKRAQQGSLQGSTEFKTEIELLSRIHHKNVVSLVGFCYEQGEQMLVYEYISNGTLKDNLSGNLGMRLNWIKRLIAAQDSARGLSYLHELANPPIIHRDVKSTNILLDDNLNAKVADFGLSKLLGDSGKSYVTTQVKGTLGYMDPEYFMTQQLTDKSDVYSFGVVLFELITARAPINQGKYIVKVVTEAMDKSKTAYRLHEILDPALGLGTRLVGLERFVDLAMSCVRESGPERPGMGEVVREIESIIKLAMSKSNPDSVVSNDGKNLYEPTNLYEPYDNNDTSSFDYSSVFVPFHTELR